MNISIIEDNNILLKILSQKIKKAGYSINSFNSYNNFMNLSDKNSDLFIIDIGLGDGNGLEIVKYLRDNKNSNAGIIIASSYNTVDNKVYGLDIGADDYITKPFTPEELLARIRAVIRRKKNSSNNSILEYNNIVLKQSTRQVFKDNKQIKLTPKEKQLLEYFIINKGILVLKNDIINSVWGSNDSLLVSDNTINATISKVKKKLYPNFKLKTIVGEGYILEK